MSELSFNEIKDGYQFEDLVAAFLRSSMGLPGCQVKPVGVGPDGGKDIIYEFLVQDLIKSATRRWIIQCKFSNQNISVANLGGISIADLIRSHKACGYLLVCRNRATSGLVDHFDRLSSNCKDGYHYEIWTGEQFRQKLLLAPDTIHQQFFPKYFEYLASRPKKNEQ